MFEGYNKTRSIFNLEDKCVSFIKSEKFLKHLEGVDKDVYIVVPTGMDVSGFSENIKFYFSDTPKYTFTKIHNSIYSDFIPALPTIGNNCTIHETVVMNVEGMRLSRDEDNRWCQFIHTGNIVVEDNVDIGPYTIIHRGTFEDTLIKRGCKIGAQNNIGHNTIIGKHTVVTAGVVTGGSVIIGSNCLLGMGALIKNGIKICDNTTVGMGAVVTKNITNSGTYVGNPARRIGADKKEFV